MWQSHQTVRQTSLLRTLQDTAEEKHGEEKRVSTKVILEKKSPNMYFGCNKYQF